MDVLENAADNKKEFAEKFLDALESIADKKKTLAEKITGKTNEAEE